ncbi:hypothetical protein ABZ383_00675 [Streptomyces sp. NPDC005900]|uniref:hypothetical protein n=1 Tax=Streptomyces sp. NPDC005900 TaxID=3154569 RepID=UPI003411A825
MKPDAGQDLTRLIRWQSALDDLIHVANRSDLRDGPSVRLDRLAVLDVLRRCVSRELDVFELPRWAGAVQLLDRVEIDEVDADLLTQFLFEVSSPELFDSITVDVCQRWIERLEHA